MNQTNCLRQDDIAGYILGKIDDDKMEDIGNHLANCPRCQAIADELESSVSDPLTDVLHGPKPDDDFSSERECQQAVSKAKGFANTPLPSSNTDEHGNVEQELPLGEHLGEYVILERLGGHMGAVYKARHPALDRFVAVKVLPARALGDEQVIARFRQEMKAVGQLEHPNIVRAYDAREIDGKHVLIMEFVKGKDLSALIGVHGSIPVADACEIIRQAAIGLQYVHEQGLVHRDVKPSNLMLTSRGDVKILDLGLARFHTARLAAGEGTAAGHIVGTPLYMAPEQVTSSNKVDTRADIYGLGCTLYALLTGRAPLDNSKHRSTSDILTAQVCKSIPPIQQSRPEVPDALAAVLDQMLAKSPSDRFDTPGQVAASLESFTSGCDLRALHEGHESRHQSGQKQPTHKATPHHPSSGLWKLVAVVAVVIMLILGGQWGLDRFREVSTLPGEPSVPPVEPSTPKPRPSPGVASDEVPVETSAGEPDWLDVPNARQTFAVHVEVDHPAGIYRGPPAGPDARGELMHVKVTSEKEGYLYLIYRSADGKLSMLFPNKHQKDNKIVANKQIGVPHPDADFQLRVGPPYGKELLKAVVSLVPLEPKDFGVKSLTDAHTTPLKPNDVKGVFVELKKEPKNWAEGRVEVTTNK